MAFARINSAVAAPSAEWPGRGPYVGAGASIGEIIGHALWQRHPMCPSALDLRHGGLDGMADASWPAGWGSAAYGLALGAARRSFAGNRARAVRT